MTRQHLRMELLDYVRDLTQTHTHREHYTIRRHGTWYGQDHVTTVPPLLEQLAYAPPSMEAEEHGGAGGFESRPAASLESIDTLVRIDLAASRWVKDLGEDDPSDTIVLLRRLGSLAASQPVETRRELEREVRRWWTWARIATGWDSPAWKPDNTCPLCGRRGSLRVKLADGIGFCTECHETWDPATIGLLADHIRAETESERPPRSEPWCWCPWPRPPEPGRWPGLCPRCGSRWCRRALPGGRMSA